MNRNNKRENAGERGNALIYVLIAIALFAALSMTMSRRIDTGEAGTVSDEKAELYALQLMNYAVQAKSAVEQMLFTGEEIDNLDFILPGEAAFNTAPHASKVYHPQGGGLNPGVLPDEVGADTVALLTPGWYMGRFSDVEWTKSTDHDVLLVAYEISETICAKINLRLTGSETIPTLAGFTNLHNVFIDPAVHSSGGAADLTSALCAACDGYKALCVERGGAYAFYNVIAQQ